MRKIIQLDFKRIGDTGNTANYSHVDLTDSQNLFKIEKYILPIIVKNEGWGTNNLTYEGFKKNPTQYQSEIDATLFSNVHVALGSNEKPEGILEYLSETLDKPISTERMSNLKNLLSNKNSWDYLIKNGIISCLVLEKFFPDLKEYLSSKIIYSEIGVVVSPNLQGKKSGVSEELYKLISNGINFGWTSNPLVIYQFRKNFNNLLYFPMLGEQINSVEFLACLAILTADLLTYESSRWKPLEYGALSSPYFVPTRDVFYLNLAKNFADLGKITKLDKKRIDYCISKKSVQSAVFAFN